MGLSAEQRKRLDSHYAFWGIDELRRQLERDDRDRFTDPDVTAYAQEWIEKAQKEIRDGRKELAILVSVGSIFAGLVIGVFLAS
jgi:hypothetical protein